MFTRLLTIFLLLFVLIGCANTPTKEATVSVTPTLSTTQNTSAKACTETEPARLKFPEDSAIPDPPAFGYYYVNEDLSIWASAARTSEGESYWRAGKNGVKVGWFRPAGAPLEVTGQRLDGKAPPLEAEFPCCYPTRFQASGLYFPTEGCWKINAKAADRKLTFVVWVEPE